MITKALKKYFGFSEFRKGQKQVIENICNHESALAVFPTGAGKSLCYQLPALILENLTLVVSPLIALMQDQIDFLQSKGIAAAKLDSTLSHEEYNKTIQEAKNGELKILMISVERFRNERFRTNLRNMKISLMVVDEAHCISEWGHNFRPDYLKIPRYKKEYDIPNILLLTATATPQVVADMCSKFKIPKKNISITGFYRKNLKLLISPKQLIHKDIELIKELKQLKGKSTIVYVTLQKTTEEVATILQNSGINAIAYHAGINSESRLEIQNKFMNSEVDCIVATIAFGMGIDKSNIRAVIHYDLPKSIESYSQEIGRSGRDGEEALCLMLANGENITTLENFVYGDTPEKEEIETILLKIKNCSSKEWETKLHTLSSKSNIRLLTLKTLLVYLEVNNIISPTATYFDEYRFKALTPSNEILTKLKGEKKEFITNLFKSSTKGRIWINTNVKEFSIKYNQPRNRAVNALEYFHEKKWIFLEASKSVDVFEILNSDFNIEVLSNDLYNLFKTKEEASIKRISEMIEIFESDTCISFRLASYFGQTLEQENCGHCSYCLDKKKAKIYNLKEKVLDLDIEKLIEPLINIVPEATPTLITKYLCGITCPILTRVKARKLGAFGRCEKISFNKILNKVESLIISS